MPFFWTSPAEEVRRPEIHCPLPEKGYLSRSCRPKRLQTPSLTTLLGTCSLHLRRLIKATSFLTNCELSPPYRRSSLSRRHIGGPTLIRGCFSGSSWASREHHVLASRVILLSEVKKQVYERDVEVTASFFLALHLRTFLAGPRPSWAGREHGVLRGAVEGLRTRVQRRREVPYARARSPQRDPGKVLHEGRDAQARQGPERWVWSERNHGQWFLVGAVEGLQNALQSCMIWKSFQSFESYSFQK